MKGLIVGLLLVATSAANAKDVSVFDPQYDHKTLSASHWNADPYKRAPHKITPKPSRPEYDSVASSTEWPLFYEDDQIRIRVHFSQKSDRRQPRGDASMVGNYLFTYNTPFWNRTGGFWYFDEQIGVQFYCKTGKIKIKIHGAYDYRTGISGYHEVGMESNGIIFNREKSKIWEMLFDDECRRVDGLIGTSWRE